MSINTMTYQATKKGQNVAQLYTYAYFCTNRTRSASRKISKWVFFFLGRSYSNNTPSLPLSDAHLEGIFFLGAKQSFIKNNLTNG